MVKREEGMIEPTITGWRTKPSKNTPHGPSARLRRRLNFCGSASRASWVLVMRENRPWVAAGKVGMQGVCKFRGSMQAPERLAERLAGQIIS